MKSHFTFFTILFTAFLANGQDVLIKTDKNEIQAKVLEIEDDNVKYKLFEFQDGPTYNLKKEKIFMIIYENGKREIFKKTTPALAENETITETITETISSNQEAKNNTSAREVKQVYSSKISEEENTKYNPLKLLVYTATAGIAAEGGGASATAITVEVTGEGTIIKNYLNYGVNGFVSSISGNSSVAYGAATASAEGMMYGGGLFLNGFFSLNRIMGNLQKQHVGLFPFVRWGYVYATWSQSGSGQSGGGEYTVEYESPSYSGFYGESRLGADYLFSKSFGITALASFDGSFGGGIVYNW